MADRSLIEWTDATWNPVRARRTLPDGVERIGWHCEHVSEGCRNCYAERFNRRGLGTGLDYKPGHLRTAQRPRGEVQVFLDMKMLLQPLKWRAPRKIFVGSMTDVFADFVTDEMLDRMFAVMAIGGLHTYQVLTKRPERMRRYFSALDVVRRICTKAARQRYDVTPDPDRNPRSFQRLMAQSAKLTAWTAAGGCAAVMFERREPGRDYPSWVTWPLPNVWLGTSIENRAALIERAGHLRLTPAAVRFFSCEPLIGDLGDVVLSDIDWVICGGESGPNARPMHPDWARSLRDQCAAAGVPFFFKQWGEYGPCELHPAGTAACSVIARNGEHLTGHAAITGFPEDRDAEIICRFGKAKAGRLLDGVEHNGMPVPA